MKALNDKLQEQFNKMMATGKLFRSRLNGGQVWDIYLGSFTPENNPIFRDPESSVHNCNYCKSFVRRYGNVVAIGDDFKPMTIFDVEIEGEYQETVKALSEYIKAYPIEGVFVETYVELFNIGYTDTLNKSQELYQLGYAKNVKRYTQEEADKFGVVKPNEVRTFNHIHLMLEKQFVDFGTDSVEAISAKYRDAKNVFLRGMQTISLDTLELVKDLINQGSLLDGTTHLYKIEQIIPLKREFDQLDHTSEDNWAWVKSYNLPFAKFRNELIGVLCSELSEGQDLNKAVQAWNKRVDPQNFMKAKAPISKKQIAEAQKFVEENGYTESFDRRFATLEDIKVSEILHTAATGKADKAVSIFDKVKPNNTRHKRNEFDKVEEVGIDKFLKDILPGVTSIEAFVTSSLENNFVSLTTAKNPDSKPIFKWSNNYSWTFNGNLAGKSQIKEAVKTAGGNVEGILRFSMIWNDSGNDHSDLDAWCTQPDRGKIGFSAGYRKDSGNKFSSCGGQLDLDNTNPGSKVGIENIYFKDVSKLKDGKYTFYVNQFSARNSQGFRAEIEMDGETFIYDYPRAVSGNIIVAEVTVNDGRFTIEHKLPVSGEISKEIYGIQTNEFVPVNLVSLSPNHWDDNKVGNKFYMFMLEGAKSPVSIRSFHSENLLPELAVHRRVLEILGSTTMIESTKKQLSGLGFNSTVRDELVLRLGGSHRRIVKVKF